MSLLTGKTMEVRLNIITLFVFYKYLTIDTEHHRLRKIVYSPL